MNFDCLPTLIAQPYAHSIQESVQRKDYQYYTLEYALGLLSSITFACILHEYQMTQDTEESSATDQYKERVASIRTRLNADIGQMSMGKWMGIARDSTKLLKALSFSHPVTELLLPISDPKHIFHKSSNTLIKKRNDDMHGHPIPKDRLQKELDKRQELLEHVLSTFDFCAHVEFVYLEGYSITGGEVLYYGKKYQGVHPTAFQLKTNTNLPIKKLLLLYKKKDILHHLDLSPMLVCASVSDSEEEHCALYTKRTKNGKELGFVSLSGRSILELNKIQDTPLEDLEQRYTNLMYLLADPSKVLVESPEINASWLLPKMSNGEGREVHKTFELELDIVNQSSKTAAESLTFVQELPFGFSIEGFDDEYREHIEVDHINRIIQLNIEQLNAKEKLLPKPKIQVQCSEQGYYQLGNGSISFSYSNIDPTAEDLHAEGEMSGCSVEVRDNNAQDQFTPILNVYMRHTPIEGNKIEIGSPFSLDIEVENIGFAPANKIFVDVLFPEYISVLSGASSIVVRVEPQQKKMISFKLISWKAGCYKIALRDILFMDSRENRYISSTTKEHHVLVRSNRVRYFRYQLTQAYDDLFISPSEQEEVDALFHELSHLTENRYAQIEQEVFIERIRYIISRKDAGRFGVKERLEGIREQRSSERQYLLFFSDIFPVFSIDRTDPSDIIIHSQRTGFSDSAITQAQHSRSYVLLREKVSFSEIRNNKKYGLKFFHRWIGMCFRRLEKLFLWKQFAEKIQQKIGGQGLRLIRNRLSILMSEEDCEGFLSPLSQPFSLVLDMEKENTYHFVFTCIDSNVKQEMHRAEHLDGQAYMRVQDHVWSKATRKSKRIAIVDISIQSEKDMDKGLAMIAPFLQVILDSITKHSIGDSFAKYQKNEAMRLQPLIEQSSTLGVYVYGKGRAWLYARSNVFPTRMKSRDILGSIFIHSRRYHLGIFFRKEAAFSASLLQKGFLSEHESKTLCTWEVSSLDDSELSMLFQILDDQVSRCTEDSFVPQALQNTLFSMMCGWYGVPFWLLTQERIEGKNCVQNQLLQDQVRKNRREKLFHDLTTSFAQWSCTPFLQQKSDVVCIHPTYATQVSVWSKTKREMCTNILSTLKRVQTKLETCFVAEHGWIVESSNQIETQMKIQLTNKNWSPNISILVLGMRDFFDSLFMGVSYKRTIQNKASWGRLSDSLLKTMKPIYPDAKSLPGWWPAGVFVPELRKTGGHNWVYNTEESQEGFACAIVEQFQQWSLVHSHIESYEET